MQEDAAVAEVQDLPEPPAAAPLRAPARPLSDLQLADCVQRLRLGDEAALARLYDATAPRVHALALRILRDPALAEEVLSDVYLQAWRSAAAYEPGRGAVIAWLLMMCRSRAVDALRRRAAALPYPAAERDEDLAAEGGDPADLCAMVEEGSRVHQALAALPVLPRQMIALAFLRGYTHAEIAEHLGMPLGTVKSLLRRTLLQLRGTLGGADGLR